VAERAHGVEEVRAEGEPGVGRAHELVVGRLGVARAGDRPRAGDQLDRLERARELGRERHDPHAPGAQELLEHAAVDRPQVLGVVGAVAGGGEEGALEMDAEDARPRGVAGLLERLEQPCVALQRPRDRGGEIRRHPGARQLAADRLERARIDPDVGPEGAVHLEVDEARGDQSPDGPPLGGQVAVAGVERDRLDAAVADDDARAPPALRQQHLSDERERRGHDRIWGGGTIDSNVRCARSPCSRASANSVARE
jgi:hypothetical protein